MKPVYDRYFADPFVWRHDGAYYAIGTGERASAGGVFEILTSPDLSDWTSLGPAMPPLHPDFGDAYWAPEVAWHEGKFYLYYSVGRGDKAHHLRVAASVSPAGPFEDSGERLTDPFEQPFAIDASPFQDSDGQWYLYYARDFLDREDGQRTGTGVVVDRLEGMTKLAGDPKTVVRPRYDWQLFAANRVMYGARWDWHTIEGPCVRKHRDRYYCLFSAGCWENDSYGVDFAVAEEPAGPFRSAGGERGPRVLQTIPGRLIGPGHNSIVEGPDGRDFIVFHAWDPGMGARRMYTAPLTWMEDGPRVIWG